MGKPGGLKISGEGPRDRFIKEVEFLYAYAPSGCPDDIKPKKCSGGYYYIQKNSNYYLKYLEPTYESIKDIFEGREKIK